jgi:uncharacterized protein YnzC (UPF0291/DUF896 family)
VDGARIKARVHKQSLLSHINELDKKADSGGIDGEEWAFRYRLKKQLLAIFHNYLE